ncbi:ABC transporter ATP-binding protein [Gracilibacillus phocaeensis]|uniref:ABC transporter ATP-binding protein n=1 Tax=Gracilibacillus phocaeensis TaxID=2042304 RepID=UPI00103128F3|nr:ABC transporter ATP-binding protein [Gracilibacillus phocaeensis]
MLDVKGLQVAIQHQPTLTDITFTLPQGSITALIGHNGAGKSTIMKTIMGWQEKKKGQIHLNHMDQDQHFIPFKRQLAYIPEEPFLLPELTTMQHVQLYGQSYQMDEDTFENRVRMLTETFEINDKLNEYPEALSKGMRQKVQTICALLPDVSLLLIDEPFMGLDIYATNDLLKLLQEKAAKGTSILLTSYQLALVKDLADRYMMLTHGKIEEEWIAGFQLFLKITTE